MNIELFNQIKQRITAESELFDMNDWSQIIHTGPGNVCNTAHCIGGWAAVIKNSYRIFGSERWLDIGEANLCRLLDIPLKANDVLFYHFGWDEPFKTDYLKAEINKDHKLKAKIACDYIDYFMNDWKDTHYDHGEFDEDFDSD